MNQYLKVALQAVHRAEPLFLKGFHCAKKTKIKNGNWKDVVTEIDVSIERLVRAALRENFPAHKIIGEELGQEKPGPKDLFWIIDPIDGTANFVHGLPYCCISLALWDRGGPLVGVVLNPVLNRLYSAVRTGGARLNGKKACVGRQPAYDRSFGSVGWGRNDKLGSRLVPLFLESSKIRCYGSTAMELCEVASGNLDFFVSGSAHIWDMAAGILLVKEAGGKITDWNGREPGLNTSQFVASNKLIHKGLLAKVKIK